MSNQYGSQKSKVNLRDFKATQIRSKENQKTMLGYHPESSDKSELGSIQLYY